MKRTNCGGKKRVQCPTTCSAIRALCALFILSLDCAVRCVGACLFQNRLCRSAFSNEPFHGQCHPNPNTSKQNTHTVQDTRNAKQDTAWWIELVNEWGCACMTTQVHGGSRRLIPDLVFPISFIPPHGTCWVPIGVICFPARIVPPSPPQLPRILAQYPQSIVHSIIQCRITCLGKGLCVRRP